MVLKGVICYCMVLHAQYCIVFFGITWYCMASINHIFWGKTPSYILVHSTWYHGTITSFYYDLFLCVTVLYGDGISVPSRQLCPKSLRNLIMDVLQFSENRALVLREPCSGSLCWQWNHHPLPSFCCCQVFCGKLSRELNQSLRSSLWSWKTIGPGKCSHGDVYCRKWPYPCSGPILSYPTCPILSLFRLIH